MSDLIGKEIPNKTLIFMDQDKGPQPLKIHDFCKKKKIVIFGVPGAFTPTCARNHLPGFIQNADKIKDKGVDEIICFATNDIFTMTAWEEISGSNRKIKFLSDSKAKFDESLGTDYPDTFGTSIKTKRCSLLVKDKIIEQFFVEDDGGKVDVSGADKMISLL